MTILRNLWTLERDLNVAFWSIGFIFCCIGLQTIFIGYSYLFPQACKSNDSSSDECKPWLSSFSMALVHELGFVGAILQLSHVLFWSLLKVIPFWTLFNVQIMELYQMTKINPIIFQKKEKEEPSPIFSWLAPHPLWIFGNWGNEACFQRIPEQNQLRTGNPDKYMLFFSLTKYPFLCKWKCFRFYLINTSCLCFTKDSLVGIADRRQIHAAVLSFTKITGFQMKLLYILAIENRGGRCSFFLTMQCFNDAMFWNS